MRRVVVTGLGGLCAIGDSWPMIAKAFQERRSGIRRLDHWATLAGLRTHLAGMVPEELMPTHYERKQTRSMGRVAMLATRATEQALDDAGLLDDPLLQSGKVGIAYGSSIGTPQALSNFVPLWFEDKMKGISATAYLQMMPHTCAANIAVFFGITGRTIAACSACTSGSQNIGYAFETVRSGKQTVMVAGGAEEVCVTIVAVFDSMYAASTRNETPEKTPRPFDRDRDGIVLGEGAATLVLEELGHAQARGATIYGEIVGFGTNTDGQHLTNPGSARMEECMRLALDDAGVTSEAIGYISAHAAGTQNGDSAEAVATARVFGRATPVSSVKGYIGHTLGASGALEAWWTLQMMRDQWFAPTLNLEQVDPACAVLDHVIEEGRVIDTEYALSNNFAFGGTNTSLVLRRWC